jgi:hypothetical protein
VDFGLGHGGEFRESRYQSVRLTGGQWRRPRGHFPVMWETARRLRRLNVCARVLHRLARASAPVSVLGSSVSGPLQVFIAWR